MSNFGSSSDVQIARTNMSGVGVKMWVATVDCPNEFDTTRHKSLWIVLAQFSIEPKYSSLWTRLYADKKATVSTDKESDVFEKKGTKQGDPLSNLLFNTGLQAALEHDLMSLEQLRSMMFELKKSTESVGLKIHPDETKIFSNH